MNQTIEDSKELGIFYGGQTIPLTDGKIEMPPKVANKANGVIDCILNGEITTIKLGDAEILKNGTLRTNEGKIISKNNNYEQVKENNKNRITKLSLEKAKREGRILDIKEIKAKKQISNDVQELA